MGGKIQFTAKIYPLSCSKRDLIKSPALDFTQPDIKLEQVKNDRPRDDGTKLLFSRINEQTKMINMEEGAIF